MLQDMELTIVHELVHLELAALPRSQASRSTEEHAVNGIRRRAAGTGSQAVALHFVKAGSLQSVLSIRDRGTTSNSDGESRDPL